MYGIREYLDHFDLADISVGRKINKTVSSDTAAAVSLRQLIPQLRVEATRSNIIRRINIWCPPRLNIVVKYGYYEHFEKKPRVRLSVTLF